MIAWVREKWTIIGIVWKYQKARDYWSKQDYGMALNILEGIYERFSDTANGIKPPYYVDLTMGAIASTVGKFMESDRALASAIQKIERNQNLSVADKNYLLYYCKYIYRYRWNEPIRTQYFPPFNYNISFGDLEFDKVQLNLQRDFRIPRPLHSDKLVDGI